MYQRYFLIYTGADRIEQRRSCKLGRVGSRRTGFLPLHSEEKVGITPVARLKKRISMKAVKIFGKFPRCRGKLAIFKSNQSTEFASFSLSPLPPPPPPRGRNEFPLPLFSFSPSFLDCLFHFLSPLHFSFPPPLSHRRDSNTAPPVSEPVYFRIRS